MRCRRSAAGWDAAALVVAVVVAGASVAMLASIAARAGDAVEALSRLTLGVAVVSAACAVSGAAVCALSSHRDEVLLAVTASVLLVAAFALSIFGILLLPFVLGTVAVLGRRAVRRNGLALGVLAGPAVAVGLAVLVVIWAQPPLVDCRQDGVVGSSRPWWGTSSGSGATAGSSPSEAVSVGSIDTPSGRYAYRCEGSRLTEFRRT